MKSKSIDVAYRFNNIGMRHKTLFCTKPPFTACNDKEVCYSLAQLIELHQVHSTNGNNTIHNLLLSDSNLDHLLNKMRLMCCVEVDRILIHEDNLTTIVYDHAPRAA
uniref:hypothetical protein n=1 Tax=Thaumasiovibrio occultus TaxID=1891184 RepID=UPI000B34B1AE|nr:hypothetical protein [Thaumasiovibrio occultus]